MAAELPARVAVAIVGGGPAGLAAATELRRLGVGPIAILEREDAAGGIPRHCGHYPFGMRELGRVLTGPDYARRMAARAADAGVAILTGVTVTAILPGPRLAVATAAGLGEIAADRVLLATGVREATRAARLLGGDKPAGVISTGALQGLVYLAGRRPFARPVILGSELVAFSALLTCRHLGIRPVAMVEPGPRAVARWPAAWLPRLMGVPLHLSTEVAAIEGRERVEAVVLRDARGRERRIAADGVVVSGRFLPEASLLRDSGIALDPASGGPVVDEYGRISDPAVFAAGNLLRAVETAGWSAAEGKRAGRAIALDLAGRLPAGSPVVVAAGGTALKYVVPQRFAGAAEAEACGDGFQLRVVRPVRGRLVLRAGAAELWSAPVDTLPERRIRVPFAAVAASDAPGPWAFVLEEEGGRQDAGRQDAGPRDDGRAGG